jgi:HxlR-like helix-turn-helix
MHILNIMTSPRKEKGPTERLEDAGIVERRFYEQHPPRAEYLLTEKGKDLRPVLRALLDWGQHHTKYPTYFSCCPCQNG